MGLCASASAGSTASASVSPTRQAHPPAGKSVTAGTDASSDSKASASVSANASQRTVTLRQVGEQSFMSNLVMSGGSITEQYDIDGGEVLGEGMSVLYERASTVHKRKLALKAVKKNRLQREKIMDMTEIEIINTRPSNCQVVPTLEDHSYIYMIMELCTGGELFDGLANCPSGHYEEDRAAELIQRCCRRSTTVICECLSRDLKLENFILKINLQTQRLNLSTSG